LPSLLPASWGVSIESFLPYALALIAGNFIYLASADLMPELHESSSVWHSLAQIVFIIVGAALVLAPEFFLGGH
jgi:zinc and cadmium transporter